MISYNIYQLQVHVLLSSNKKKKNAFDLQGCDLE